ncbi:uncharacterized protein TNCV_4818551 [Trichonephila clavipes]|nr:uncharacterized protein TNCV_4818551 [Trichonephila clavipes]
MGTSSGTQNVVANVLSRNPVESIIGEKVNCAIIRDLVLSSREQLIEEQRKDPELSHIYIYLENPEDSSVNATIYQGGRHTGKADKRGPLIRSPAGSWSELSRKLKRRRKENIGYKRSRESGSGGPERKIKKGLEHRVAKRVLSSNYNNDLSKFRKKGRTEETVIPSTSGYNLRPRKGTKAESRRTIEPQQEGPVRVRNSREKHYSPYIEEQARSGSKNTRRGSQQQNGQERKRGANTKRSISLEVLIGDVNYKL